MKSFKEADETQTKNNNTTTKLIQLIYKKNTYTILLNYTFKETKFIGQTLRHIIIIQEEDEDEDDEKKKHTYRKKMYIKT